MHDENPFRPPLTPAETGTDPHPHGLKPSLLSVILLISSTATLSLATWLWEDGPVNGTIARMLLPAGTIQVGCLLGSLIYWTVGHMRKAV